jgi:hypothetical protein
VWGEGSTSVRISIQGFVTVVQVAQNFGQLTLYFFNDIFAVKFDRMGTLGIYGDDPLSVSRT